MHLWERHSEAHVWHANRLAQRLSSLAVAHRAVHPGRLLLWMWWLVASWVPSQEVVQDDSVGLPCFRAVLVGSVQVSEAVALLVGLGADVGRRHRRVVLQMV